MRSFPRQYDLKPDEVLFYTHIPKTAGMTFRTLIEDHFDQAEICPATLDDEVEQIADLSPYRLFRGHLVYVDLRQRLPQKRIIPLTMLREPASQLVSHYEYIRRMPEDPFYPQVKDMTLNEYVVNFQMGELQRNVQTYHIAKAAQFEIDHLSAQEIFEIAIESLHHFAFTGILERFQDSLFLLSYIFGWRPIINDRQENVGGKSRDLPHQTLQLIQEHTTFDQMLYQQAREIFAERFEQMVEDLLKGTQMQQAQTNRLQPNSGELRSTVSELEALLERHYERRYQVALLSKSLPESADSDSSVSEGGTFSYTFNQALRGRGWQRREYPAAGLTYRWTGADTCSTLDLPMQITQDLTIECRVICAESTAPDILDSLTLTVNETTVPLTLLHYDPVMRLFQGSIPQSAQTPQLFTRLMFQVNRVVEFRSLDPLDTDRRSIGVAMNQIKVFPVAAEKSQSLALQLFDREFWQAPITFLQDHLKPMDIVIAPRSFQMQLDHPLQAYTQISRPVQWVVLQKDQTENLGLTLLKLWVHRYHPVFANGLFVIFSTACEIPKLHYTSVDVKPLYVDVFKRKLRKITTFLQHDT